MKYLLASFVVLLRRPLTIAQALSSLAGAGSVVLAAALMDAGDFTRFSLLTLVGSVMLGLVNAALFQPALIRQRLDPRALVPWHYAWTAALGSAALFTGASAALGVDDPRWLAALGLSSICPVLHDWLRFRAIALDRRWGVVQSDLIRVLCVPVALLVPGLTASSLGFQVFLASSTLLSTVFLAWRLPRIGAHSPYRSYAGAAGWQLVDYVLGQFLIAVPLLALGIASGSALIGGVRLAQSLLGPLNLLFAAATNNLVADGSTRAELASNGSVIHRGRKLGHALAAVSLAVVLVAVAVVAVSGLSLRGVDNRSLLVGLLVIGATAVTTNWANVHAVVLRILDRQGRVTAGRGLIAVPSVAAFSLGYLFGGVDGSLVAGLTTLAVAAPAVFLSMANLSYRSLLQHPTVAEPVPS